MIEANHQLSGEKVLVSQKSSFCLPIIVGHDRIIDIVDCRFFLFSTMYWRCRYARTCVSADGFFLQAAPAHPAVTITVIDSW